MEKQVKILVVDDDNNLRETLVDLLEIEGYKVYQAGTAAECLELCSNEFFNVILMDYNLPDETGMELIRKSALLTKLRRLLWLPPMLR